MLRRILGRRQNMLVLPSGQARWPLLSSGDLRTLLAIAPIRQYQFVQHRPEAIELRVAVRRPLQPGEAERLSAWVREKFGHSFAVDVTCHDELPLGPAGKFQDFVSTVAPP